MSAPLTITDYRSGMRDALVALWRASFLHGVGTPVPHPEDEHRRYFDEHVLADTTVQVALRGDALAGFVSFTPESVVQLYVDVAHHGRGVGSALLDLAKERSNGSLWLYTFASNTRAQRFYEGRGFEILERGFEPTLQRADILYGWKRHRLPPLGAASR